VIHAASRLALAELGERVEAVFGRAAGVDELTQLAEQLYAVVDLLIGQPQLRRKAADPTVHAEQRAQLITTLFDGKIADGTLAVLREAVSLRWSSPWDLLDALEITGDEALLKGIELNGNFEGVEDDLFRFERILDGDSRLTTLLDDYAAQPERRVALVTQLVEGKVDALTQRLLEHAVASQRKRSITHAIDALLELAARRRGRWMARVVTAAPLTSEQEARLSDALTEMYGRSITIRVAVDPRVRGGLVVRIGDEVIDGSVAARIAQIRTALAS